MSARDVGQLACRILGVFTWITGLQTLGFFLWGTTSREQYLWMLAVAVAFGLVGALLFFGAARIASVLPAPEEEKRGDERIAAIAFSVLGLWYVLVSLPSVAGEGWELWFWDKELPRIGTVLGFVVHVLVAMFGAALFLQMKGVDWVYRRCAAPRRSVGDLSLSPQEPSPLQTLAFSAIGLYFVLFGIRGLLGTIDTALISHHLSPPDEALRWPRFPWVKLVLHELVSLAVGVFVFVKSRWLAGLWARLQGGAVEAGSEPPGSRVRAPRTP